MPTVASARVSAPPARAGRARRAARATTTRSGRPLAAMTAAGADDETHSCRRETTRPTIASSRRAAAALAAAALVLSSPSASLAKTVNVTVDPDTLTAELCDDPRAGGVPGTATYKARCMQISGVATNPTKDVVYNADVYGSVKDAANDEVLNSGRVGSIAEVPPGESAFRLQITVATSQPLPLKLKAFKAQGVTSRLNASPNPYDDYTEFDDFGAQK